METFPEHVERLRADLGITQSRLINEAATYDEKGLSPETIRNAVTGRRGVELPKLAVIESVAGVLDVDPDVFAAYRIQRAAARLDPVIVGPANALANADLLLSRSTPTARETARRADRQRRDKRRESKRGRLRPAAKGGGA